MEGTRCCALPATTLNNLLKWSRCHLGSSAQTLMCGAYWPPFIPVCPESGQACKFHTPNSMAFSEYVRGVWDCQGWHLVSNSFDTMSCSLYQGTEVTTVTKTFLLLDRLQPLPPCFEPDGQTTTPTLMISASSIVACELISVCRCVVESVFVWCSEDDNHSWCLKQHD